MKAFKFSLSVLVALALLLTPLAGMGEETAAAPVPDEGLRQIQLRLKELGFFYGDVNGLWNDYTQIAVENFQKANGLAVTGVTDAVFGNKLNDANAVSKAEYLENVKKGEVYEKVIAPGENGKTVKRLQTRLSELHYYAGKIDSRYEAATEYAVKLFQFFNDLPVTGVADPQTIFVLTSPCAAPASEEKLTAVLRYGDEGNDVKRLQLDLQTLGYFTGDCSGKFGRKTQEALIAFQKANDLEMTGECDIDLSLLVLSGSAVTRMQADETEATKLLILGDDDLCVSTVKAQLNALGFYTGEMGSLFTQELAQSVSYFQEANQLPANGIADTATRILLNAGEAVNMDAYTEMMKARPSRLGDANYAVQLLQMRLNTLGYFDAAVSGVFDKETQNAVLYVQKINMLMENGEADGPLLAYIFDENTPDAVQAEESYYARLESNRRRQMSERVCEVAMKSLAAPFEAGKVGPGSFGNAGLVYYCFDSVDVKLDPTVMLQLERAQARSTWNEDPTLVEEGQQVFYRQEDAIITGIYVGERVFIYASAEKGMVIAIENMAEMEEYEFVGSVSYF